MKNVFTSILMLIFLFPAIHVSSFKIIEQPSISQDAPFGSYRYVMANGDGPLNCPKNDPCNFYDAYVSSPMGDTLVFMSGTYTEDTMGYPAEMGEVLQLESKTLFLIGGWDGDPTLGVDPVFNPSIPTILNGENNKRGITIKGSGFQGFIWGFTIYYGDATNAYNSHCYAAGTSGSPVCGGGIYIDPGNSVSLYFNTIGYNKASGDPGVFGVGGGIYAYQNDELEIFHNTILYNSANGNGGPGMGGGIYINECNSSDVSFEYNTIEGNNAAYNPNMGWGAGMLLEDSSGVVITGNLFSANNDMGIVDMHGSALYATLSVVDIFENQFLDNINGHVIYLYDSPANIQRNVINNPQGKYGITVSGGKTNGETSVINNFIVNHAWGNVMLIGTVSDYADVNLYYNTLATFQGGDSTNGVIVHNYVDMIFSHGIVANHWYGFSDVGHTAGSITIDYNLVYSNDLTNYHNFTPIATNSFSGDPKFVNYANASSADYHIRSLSAARDKGPGLGGLNKDIDSQARPNPLLGMMNGNDLGADEWWGWFLPIIKK